MANFHLKRTRCIPAGAWLAFACLLASCTAVGAETLAEISVPSGQELFAEHCAQCHGEGGKGDGPMAAMLKVAPADLTAISARAGGTFPAPRVADTIRYGGSIAAHGSRVMPIWGQVFNDEGGRGKGGNAYSRRAVIELLHYLETIQKQ
jgi:mono/diheme cytochrome c family protein